MNRSTPEKSPSSFGGLIGWLEETRVELPLLLIEVRGEVCNDFASVEVVQFFEQTNSRAMDVSFVFPLPADAAVYRCELSVRSLDVRARVEEKSAARENYQQAKSAGHRAFLAEMERRNLFSLNLGNLQPGDIAFVHFAYMQKIGRSGDLRSLRVPLTPGIRYVPGKPLSRINSGAGVSNDTDSVRDASRISPPRIGSSHRDATSFSVDLCLRMSAAGRQTVSSPTHPLQLQTTGEGALNASLPGKLDLSSEVNDRDLVVTWADDSTDEDQELWMSESGYGFLRLRGPRHPDVASSGGSRPDVYFLVDRSASMAGKTWKSVGKAITNLLEQLHPTTKALVTTFGEKFQDCAEGLLTTGELLKLIGKDGSPLSSSSGREACEIVPALRHVLERRKWLSGDGPAVVVMLTAGQVGNEEELIAASREANCPINLIGLGQTPNDALRGVCEMTRGRSVFLSPDEDFKAAVSRFVHCLGVPAVTGITFPKGWRRATSFPMPNLFPFDDLVLSVCRSSRSEAEECSLTARQADGEDWTRTCRIHSVSSEMAERIWAQERLFFLDQTGAEKAAIALAKRSNLLSKDTAFVAWDEAEKVAIATHTINQPAMMPRDREAPVKQLAPRNNVLDSELQVHLSRKRRHPHVASREEKVAWKELRAAVRELRDLFGEKMNRLTLRYVRSILAPRGPQIGPPSMDDVRAFAAELYFNGLPENCPVSDQETRYQEILEYIRSFLGARPLADPPTPPRYLP